MSYNPIKDYEHIRDRLAQLRRVTQGKFQQSLLEDITQGVERLRECAASNPVTGYHGIRELRHDIQTLQRRHYNQDFDFFIITMDLDRFGDFNKRHGEKVGDAVLKAVAEILKEGTREYDIVHQREAVKTMKGYHKHGEEFEVVIQAPSQEIAYLVANRLRQDIEKRSPEVTKKVLKEKEGYKVTATLGMTRWDIDKERFEDAEARADVRMQEGKREQRNRVYYR
mgnify:CR=1 FL=1